MFDLEMVKRNFPFEKKFGQKFLVQDNVGQKFYFWSKTKLDLENQKFWRILAKKPF